jgi:hypothetical protein
LNDVYMAIGIDPVKVPLAFLDWCRGRPLFCESIAEQSGVHLQEAEMDFTGYGYKRKPQEQHVAANVVPPPGVQPAQLSPEAGRLLDLLARKCPLRQLPSRFPRVLNQIAAVWNQPSAAERCFEGLLLDSRGTRAGFPPEVLSELLALRSYNAGRIFPQRRDPWQEMHLR